MQTGELARAQDIYSRIFQLERRISMDWYSKDQLFDDLHNLRDIVYTLAKKYEIIDNKSSSYYNKIDLLLDQII